MMLEHQVERPRKKKVRSILRLRNKLSNCLLSQSLHPHTTSVRKSASSGTIDEGWAVNSWNLGRIWKE